MNVKSFCEYLQQDLFILYNVFHVVRYPNPALVHKSLHPLHYCLRHFHRTASVGRFGLEIVKPPPLKSESDSESLGGSISLGIISSSLLFSNSPNSTGLKFF